MNRRTAPIVVLVFAAIVIGAIALAKQPPPPPPQDCKRAVCASCPDGYVLKSVWPDCCTCVPAP